MKRYISLGALVASSIGITGAAYAADLGAGIDYVEPGPPVTEDFSWSGLYVGGTVGYYWADRDDPSRLCDTLDPRDGDSSAIDPNVTINDGNSTIGTNIFGLPTGNLDDFAPAYSCRPFELFRNADNQPGDGNNDGTAIFSDTTTGDEEGWLAGGYFGVNKQYGNMVVGAELEGLWIEAPDQMREFNFAVFEDSSPQLDFIRAVGAGTWETEGPDWIADATGKAGVLLGSRKQALLYVKGGFAVGDKMESTFEGGTDSTTANCDDCVNSALTSNILSGKPTEESGYGFGGTAGAGIEYKLTQNFGIGFEYQFFFLNYEGSHDVVHRYDRNTGGGVNNDIRETVFSNPFQDLMIHTAKVKATVYFD